MLILKHDVRPITGAGVLLALKKVKDNLHLSFTRIPISSIHYAGVQQCF